MSLSGKLNKKSNLSDFIWRAPAKINRFIGITGRRDDGYHEIQTVFQFVNWFDEIRFKCREDGKIIANHALPGVAYADDLSVRAALAIQAHSNVQQGVTIQLNKVIPTGAGLGGGSSDAATTLLALNQMWNCRLEIDELVKLGVRLGADVPVFIRGQCAFAEGMGEKLQPMILDEPWYLLVCPPVHVSTPEIFSDHRLTRNTEPITIAGFLSGSGENDFEPVVRKRFPEIDDVFCWLQQFADARMSGTGSCIYAMFDSLSSASDIAQQCPMQWKTHVVKGENISSLHQDLQTFKMLRALTD